jgi:DNA-3-methyladenine glycosylase II
VSARSVLVEIPPRPSGTPKLRLREKLGLGDVMTETILKLDDELMAKAVKQLCKIEPRFKPVMKAHGIPASRAAAEGLAPVLQIVCEQFLSLKAAEAIWLRVAKRIGRITTKNVLAVSQEELLSLGLSRAKAKSFHGLAAAASTKSLDFKHLATLDDDAAKTYLIKLPGIGPWTADIYLLSSLQRADVWPWGDVALQAAAQHLFNLRERPDKKKMIALAEPFRPYRAVAARLLWSHYRGMKQMPQA